MVEATLGCLGGEQRGGLASVGRRDPRGQLRTERPLLFQTLAASPVLGTGCQARLGPPRRPLPRLTSMSGMLFRFRGLKM